MSEMSNSEGNQEQNDQNRTFNSGANVADLRLADVGFVGLQKNEGLGVKNEGFTKNGEPIIIFI